MLPGTGNTCPQETQSIKRDYIMKVVRIVIKIWTKGLRDTEGCITKSSWGVGGAFKEENTWTDLEQEQGSIQ